MSIVYLSHKQCMNFKVRLCFLVIPIKYSLVRLLSALLTALVSGYHNTTFNQSNISQYSFTCFWSKSWYSDNINE